MCELYLTKDYIKKIRAKLGAVSLVDVYQNSAFTPKILTTIRVAALKGRMAKRRCAFRIHLSLRLIEYLELSFMLFLDTSKKTIQSIIRFASSVQILSWK